MSDPAAKVVRLDFDCVVSKPTAERVARLRNRLLAPDDEDDLKARNVYGRAAPFNLVYRVGRLNVCPCCSATSWHVGRTTAECAGCGSPLPLINATPGFER